MRMHSSAASSAVLVLTACCLSACVKKGGLTPVVGIDGSIGPVAAAGGSRVLDGGSPDGGFVDGRGGVAGAVSSGLAGAGGVAGTAAGGQGGGTAGGSSKLDGGLGSGGAIASGGAVASGGVVASGGAVARGGAVIAGDAAAGGLGNSGGATSSGGASGKTGGALGSGGKSSVAGASGSGGALGAGGAMAGCTGCQAHETCWSDEAGARCIASEVSPPGKVGIDATEVTRGQYAAWLATHPPTNYQIDACVWNKTFTPDPACMEKASVCQGDAACANHPQPCVDFCDAVAYCQAIRRSICGKEAWVDACSSNGTYAACYASTFVRNTCNDYTAAGSTTVPVASKTGCQPPASSAFAGVFDMIGNVAEWVDSCFAVTGASDTCEPRGLSFGNGAAAPLCSQSTYAKRSAALDTVGFRCCTY